MLNITNDAGDFNLSYKRVDDVIYFKARDVSTILGYSNPGNAVIDHVDDEYKHKLKDISTIIENRNIAGSDHNMVYLTEPGLYQLTFKYHPKSANHLMGSH